MSSTIQVDNIKDIGGNTMVSSNGSGTFTNNLPAPTSGIAASAIDSGTLADARIPNLNASKITAGTMATARLGSGTASSSTFLRGDQTYAAAGGGKVLQVVQQIMPSNFTMSSGTNALVTGMNPQITMASVTNKLLVYGSYSTRISGNSATVTPSANIFITDVSNVQKAGTYIYFNTASNTHHPTWTVCQQAMWTPGTTSAYDVKLLCNNASEGGEVQFYGVSGVAWTSFILIEIEA